MEILTLSAYPPALKFRHRIVARLGAFAIGLKELGFTYGGAVSVLVNVRDVVWTFFYTCSTITSDYVHRIGTNLDAFPIFHQKSFARVHAIVL